MIIGIIDNYDSFTYNLIHYLEDITGNTPLVCMNNDIDWAKLDSCSHLVLSPGPGLPKESGQLMEVLKRYHTHKNILGVCLGMQAIGEFFGAQLKNLEEVQHGVQTKIHIERTIENNLYRGLPGMIEVGRYHSWVLDPKQLPEFLTITSKDENGNVMSLQHKHLPIYGVQYHPESIMTKFGKKILSNWVEPGI